MHFFSGSSTATYFKRSAAMTLQTMMTTPQITGMTPTFSTIDWFGRGTIPAFTSEHPSEQKYPSENEPVPRRCIGQTVRRHSPHRVRLSLQSTQFMRR